MKVRISAAHSTLAVAALSAFAALAFFPTSANGSCVQGQPAIHWSYPANGATDIPTNADLWVTSTASSSLVSLNGQAITRRADGAYELGALTPNTAYQVVFELGETQPALSIDFVTGTGPQPEAPLALSADVDLTRNPSDFARCALVDSQGCFDTGTPTRVRFDVGAPAVAWLVERLDCDGTSSTLIWPADCGAPVLEGYDITCASIRLTDGVNISNPTPAYCSAPQLPEGTSLPTSSACAMGWPPANVSTFESEDGVTFSTANPPTQPEACSLAPRARHIHWTLGLLPTALAVAWRIRRRTKRQ